LRSGVGSELKRYVDKVEAVAVVVALKEVYCIRLLEVFKAEQVIIDFSNRE